MVGRRGLLDVRTFILSRSIRRKTIEMLRSVGSQGNEGFVLLGGQLEAHDSTLRFTSAYWPEQQARQSPDGLSVTVPGEALHRANLAFYHRGESMAGQVHTHPTEAFHSTTDDHYPLVTLLGGLSVVVPFFAKSSEAGGWAIYRLTAPLLWTPTDASVVEIQP